MVGLEQLEDRVNNLEERLRTLEQRIDEEPEEIRQQTDIISFINDFGPKTHAERVLAIGYYLEKFEGEETFTTADIENGYKRCREPLPANISDILATCEDKGWVMRAGKKGQSQIRRLTNGGLQKASEVLEYKDESQAN